MNTNDRATEIMQLKEKRSKEKDKALVTCGTIPNRPTNVSFESKRRGWKGKEKIEKGI